MPVTGFEPATPASQMQRADHCATPTCWLGGQDLNLQSATPTRAPKVTHANLQSAPLTVWIPPDMWQFIRVKYYLVLRRTEPNVSQRRNASHTQRAKIAKPYFIKSLYSVLLSVTWRAQYSLASLRAIQIFLLSANSLAHSSSNS